MKRIRDAGRQSLAEDLFDSDARFSKVMLEHVGYDDNDEQLYINIHTDNNFLATANVISQDVQQLERFENYNHKWQ